MSESIYQKLKKRIEADRRLWFEVHDLPWRPMAPPLPRKKLDEILDRHGLMIPASLYHYLVVISEDIFLYTPHRFDPTRTFEANGRLYLVVTNDGEAIDLTDDELGGSMWHYLVLNVRRPSGLFGIELRICESTDKSFISRLKRRFLQADNKSANTVRCPTQNIQHR
jgi:hypothetical protein